MMAGGSHYFTSYVVRTLVSLAVSALPVIIFALSWDQFESGTLYCQVHQMYWYECAGHPVKFYKVGYSAQTFLCFTFLSLDCDDYCLGSPGSLLSSECV